MRCSLFADVKAKIAPKIRAAEGSFFPGMPRGILAVSLLALLAPLSVPSLAQLADTRSDSQERHLKLKETILGAFLPSASTQVTAVAWSPDGEKLAAYAKFGGELNVLSADGSVERKVELRDNGYPNNSLLFLGSSRILTPGSVGTSTKDPLLSIWRSETGDLDRNVEFPSGRPPRKAWIYGASPDSLKIGVINTSARDPVTIFSTESWNIETELAVARIDSPSAISFSPDIKNVAVGYLSGIVSFFDLSKQGAHLSDISVYTPPRSVGIGAVQFSPDGKYLAVGASFILERTGPAPSSVTIWRLSDHSLVASYEHAAKSVRQLSWSSDSRLLAAAMSNNAVSIFEPAEAEAAPIVQSFGGNQVYGAQFSPTSNDIAIATENGLKIFSVEKYRN